MLCEKCSNIHFRRLTDCELVKQEPDRLIVEDTHYNLARPVFYFHHKSKNALQASSEDGCHLCAMLLDRLFGQGGSTSAAEYAFARGEVIFRRSVVDRWIDRENGFEDWNTGDWIYVQCEDRNTTFTCHGDYPGEHYKVRLVFRALTALGLMGRMLVALTSSQSATSIEARSLHTPAPILVRNPEENAEGEVGNIHRELLQMDVGLYSPWFDLSTMSLPNMLLASFWLQSCISKHTVCTDYQKKGSLPFRIINISNPQNPRLEEGLAREEPYITLSYKWGDTCRYLTTTQNLERHTQQGFPLSELPRTFEDAMFVASMLGFRWIWIDALCICQDRPGELKQEIDKMDQTFGASTLTIFAIAGDHADTGLGSMRDPRWVKPCKLTVKTTLNNDTADGSACFTLRGGEATYAPLYNRGW